MTIKERYQNVLAILEKEWPTADSELNFENNNINLGITNYETYADFSNERNVPDELFVKIKPEHFKEMSFRLSPAVKNSKKMAEILKKQEMAEVLFSLMFKLLCNELKVSQFQIPNQYEAWQG